MRKFLNFIFIILIIGSITYILKISYDIYTSKKQTNLLNEIVINEDEIIQNEIQDNVVNERMLKIAELQKENPDIKAWIEIENTNINYPVLQCDNNEFYPSHHLLNLLVLLALLVYLLLFLLLMSYFHLGQLILLLALFF